MVAPALVRPANAEAVPSPCDVAVISAVCDGATDLAEGVADGAGAVADTAKWLGHGAGQLAGAVWNATKPFLRAAAIAGLAVGVPIVCSKAAKALAAGAAAAAAAPETAGAGSVPAAAAGAAGVSAMCTLLRRGGKLALKVVAKGSGKLAKLAKLAAAATGLAALVLGTEHAAAWILQRALAVDVPSAPNLGSKWVSDIRRQLNGVAGVLLVVAAMVGLMFAGFTGRTSDVGRILTGMVGAALVIGIVGSLLFTSLQLSDRVTSGAVDSAWGQRALGNWIDLGDSYAGANPTPKGSAAPVPADSAPTQTGEGTPPDDGKGPWILRFAIAVVTVFAGALVWVELQIRDALLELLLVFSGLLLAGYAFEHLRHLAKGFAMTLLGVVVAKPILVVTLLLGGAQMQNAASTDALLPLLTGAGLMLLAGILGFRVITWMGFQGHLVDAGAMRLRGGLGSGRFGGRAGRKPSGEHGDGPSAGDSPTSGPGGEGTAARQMSHSAASRSAGASGPGVKATAASLVAGTQLGRGDFATVAAGSAGGGDSTGDAASVSAPSGEDPAAHRPDAPDGAGADGTSARGEARAPETAGTGPSLPSPGRGSNAAGLGAPQPRTFASSLAPANARPESPLPTPSGGPVSPASPLRGAAVDAPVASPPGTGVSPAGGGAPPASAPSVLHPSVDRPPSAPDHGQPAAPTASPFAEPADAIASQAARAESLFDASQLRRPRPGGAGA